MNTTVQMYATDSGFLFLTSQTEEWQTAYFSSSEEQVMHSCKTFTQSVRHQEQVGWHGQILWGDN